MATKRKRDDKPEVNSSDGVRKKLSTAITSHASAKVAPLHITGFSPSRLQDALNGRIYSLEDGLRVNAQYQDMAPLVGLDPDRHMNDVATFDLHRSRISTSLFRSIVQDMDVLLPQYGPPYEHETVAATSRFLAPIFNHLVAQFDFAFRNVPNSILDGQIKLGIGSRKERMDAIAQVIAECDGCYWNNTRRGLCAPVFGILCDGNAFQFFLFEGGTKPSSSKRGALPGDPITLRHGFKLDDFSAAETSRPFIFALRQICEIIFDLLIQSYISSLDAYRNRSAVEGKKEGEPRNSTHEWDDALRFAGDALESLRAAEKMRQRNLNEANTLAQVAMQVLKLSIGKGPIIDKTNLIMSGWDEVGVETV